MACYYVIWCAFRFYSFLSASVSGLTVIKEFVLGRSLISFGIDITLRIDGTAGVTLLRPSSPNLFNWSLLLASRALTTYASSWT